MSKNADSGKHASKHMPLLLARQLTSVSAMRRARLLSQTDAAMTEKPCKSCSQRGHAQGLFNTSGSSANRAARQNVRYKHGKLLQTAEECIHRWWEYCSELFSATTTVAPHHYPHLLPHLILPRPHSPPHLLTHLQTPLVLLTTNAPQLTPLRGSAFAQPPPPLACPSADPTKSQIPQPTVTPLCPHSPP